MLNPYSIEVEKQMQEMFNRLSEKDKRLYAGIEALKFSYSNSQKIPPPLSTLRFESHAVFWKRWVTRYSVGKGLKSFFSNLHAFFVDGFQYFHYGRKSFPGHGFSPFQSSFQGIQKRSAPMVFKNPPTALDGVIFAVIRRIVSQHDFKIMGVSKLGQALHKLSSMA